MIHVTDYSDARGVLFDLWGTLLHVDDECAATECWRNDLHAALHRRGIAVDMDVLRAHTDTFFATDAPADASAYQTVYEARLANLVTQCGHTLSRDILRVVADDSTRTWSDHVYLDAEAWSLLDQLRRTRVLGIVSNFDYPPVVRALLAHFDCGGFFKTVIVSGEAGFRKPDPRIVALALHHVALAARQVVFVGNSDEDIQAATGSGMRCVRIQGGSTTTHDSSARSGVCVVRRLGDLLPLFGNS